MHEITAVHDVGGLQVLSIRRRTPKMATGIMTMSLARRPEKTRVSKPCCKEPVPNPCRDISFLPHLSNGAPRGIPRTAHTISSITTSLAATYPSLCLGRATLADFELAVRTFVNVPVGTHVAQAAGPDHEVGV